MIIQNSLYISIQDSSSYNFCLERTSSTIEILISYVISQTPKHVRDMFNFNMTSNLCGYLVLFMSKTPSVVWYFIINSTKSPWLFRFIWVKICSHIHLYLLPNYLLQTPQIYSDFTWSFPLSKSELLYSVSLMKHSLGDLF